MKTFAFTLMFLMSICVPALASSSQTSNQGGFRGVSVHPDSTTSAVPGDNEFRAFRYHRLSLADILSRSHDGNPWALTELELRDQKLHKDDAAIKQQVFDLWSNSKNFVNGLEQDCAHNNSDSKSADDHFCPALHDFESAAQAKG